MIASIVAGILSTLLAPRIERALVERQRRATLSWTTMPRNRLR